MRNSHSHLQTLALTFGLGAAALFGACGGDETGGGTGGAKGTGGRTGSGGTRATGGSTGSGGGPATGGRTGSDGAAGSGGTTAAGGTGGFGGAIATGGTTAGSGGIDGSAGIDGAAGDAPIGIDGATGDAPISIDAPIGIDGPAGIDGAARDSPAIDAPFAPRTLFDFANTSQGWVYGSWQARDANDQPVAPFNLAASGIQIDGGAMPTIGWDGTVGDPAGSLKMAIDFSNWQQQVLPTVMFSAPLPNWTGRTITLRVKLAAVPAASLDNAGFVIYAQDDNSAMSQQLLGELPADTEWHTLRLPIVADGGSSFNAASIKSLTVGVYSRDPPATVDGGVVPAFAPAGVTVHIDSIVLR